MGRRQVEERKSDEFRKGEMRRGGQVEETKRETGRIEEEDRKTRGGKT